MYNWHLHINNPCRNAPETCWDHCIFLIGQTGPLLTKPRTLRTYVWRFTSKEGKENFKRNFFPLIPIHWQVGEDMFVDGINSLLVPLHLRTLSPPTPTPTLAGGWDLLTLPELKSHQNNFLVTNAPKHKYNTVSFIFSQMFLLRQKKAQEWEGDGRVGTVSGSFKVKLMIKHLHP